MAEYSLHTFTAGSLSTTSARWAELAGAEVYEVELVPLFEWARDNRAPRQGYGWARGLQNADTDEIEAILETVPSPRLNLTKLLKIWVSPQFWAVEPTDEELYRLADIHAGAYVTVIFEAQREGLREVKIYGRDDVAMLVLRSVERVWSSEQTGWDAKVRGRWLSLTDSAPS